MEGVKRPKEGNTLLIGAKINQIERKPIDTFIMDSKKSQKAVCFKEKEDILTHELRTIGDEDHNSNQLRYPILYSCLTDEDYIANIRHGISCDYTRYLLKSIEIDVEEEKENIMCTNKVIRFTSIDTNLGDPKLTKTASKIRRD